MKSMPAINNIRNFCIIAHIDHGKSTLADRILEYTHTIDKREFRDQVLDDMELERERGITIKAKAVRLNYPARDGKLYIFNLIDTPGHVDFSYEVSRSLAACEGALLIVDAAQGVQAQTIANVYMAMEHNLSIIPVVNKIDLESADPGATIEELRSIQGLDASHCLLVSAKKGTGTEELLEAIVQRIPPPSSEGSGNSLRALIFDSSFDTYRGVVTYIKIVSGSIGKGDKILLMSNSKEFEVMEVGIFRPGMQATEILRTGEVGYLMANIKSAREARIGDTITSARQPARQPLPGYKPAKPMVFSGLYPVETSNYGLLRDALDKLSLNDSSFIYEPETSPSFGFGFRCGFLGLLHMEIVQERLEREYDLDLVSSAPSVRYRVKRRGKEPLLVDNPARFPLAQEIEYVEEPFVRTSIISPDKYIGALMELSRDRRGIYISTSYLDPTRVVIIFEFPLGEIVMDFHDKLKSVTKGYGSLDYEYIGYRKQNVVRLDILLNGEVVEALASIVHREKAYKRGRALTLKLKEAIPRQQFPTAVQAAIGSQVVARETIRAFRKDVTEKLYGGDITRKRKLLEKQKRGKKRMKRMGKVNIPQEAFLAVVKTF
ncbi:translation elongation factor 4 [candidate division NPL-UPA2 bacterium]|nr:translation elongation factor 4 [candidate division NPL-UPA2 bacterium]